jgi:phosphatidylglycerophosphatase A
MDSAATTDPSLTTSPTRAGRPDVRFLLASPAHFVALGAGSGLPRRAPGTWGTLLAWGLFAALDRWLPDAAWGALIASGIVVGAWAAQRTGVALGQVDSGHIVVDEIVAFWLVLLLLPDGVSPAWLWQLGAFVLFRFFDIAKPPPIRWFDARFKNGFGVMLDDLVAAFLTLLVFAVAVRLA